MKNRKIIRPLKCLVLIVLLAAFLVGCSNSANENIAPVNRDLVQPPVDLSEIKIPRIENTDEQLNKKNFDQIKNGMELIEVEKIILGDVKKTNSVEKDGVLKETYRWENKDGSKYIEVMVEDDKVVGKNQKGLK